MAIAGYSIDNIKTVEGDLASSFLSTGFMDDDNPFISLSDRKEWIVTYFNKLRSDTLIVSRQFDENTDTAVDSWVEYIDFPMYVKTPLDGNVNLEEMVGTSVVPFNIIPAVGDLIKVTLNDNREVLLKVDVVKRRTFDKRPIYVIDYSIDSIITDANDIRYVNLLDKVVRTFRYDSVTKDVVTGDVLDNLEELDSVMDRLLCLWRNRIVDQEYNLITYVKEDKKYYDPDLERFALSVIPVNTYRMLDIYQLTETFSCNSFLNRFLNKDRGLLSEQYYSLNSETPLNVTNPLLQTIDYYYVDFVVSGEMGGELDYIFSNTIYNDETRTEEDRMLVTYLANGAKAIEFQALVSTATSLLGETDTKKLYYMIPIIWYLYRNKYDK